MRKTWRSGTRKKCHKYEPLSTSIKSNGWSVHLFGIEVGARGYCSTRVKSCLCRLGFSGKFLKSTIKKLSLSSLKASFQICLSRDCKRWLEEKVTISPIKTVSNVAPLSSCSVSKTTKITLDCEAIQASVKNCGILNKGSTCYINATLPSLSTMVQFCSNFNAVSETLSPFVSSFVKIMSLLKSSKSAIDPSQFLRFLKQVLVKSGRPYLNIFEQQDAGKILACFSDELCGDSILTLDLVQVKTRVTTDCLATRILTMKIILPSSSFQEQTRCSPF